MQDLDAGDSVQDVISFTASDGSIQEVTVNINGVDDGSVIGGTSVATIMEDSSKCYRDINDVMLILMMCQFLLMLQIQ